MSYTLMVYQTPEDLANRRDPAQREAYFAPWMAYVQALRDARVFAGGAGLHDAAEATTLRTHEGAPLVEDGPYANTKEQLGGFFIIDAPDLDAALAWASRAPIAIGGAVEVRPNLQTGG